MVKGKNYSLHIKGHKRGRRLCDSGVCDIRKEWKTRPK